MTLAPKAITSLQNDRVKAIRALEMRKERKETGLFVAEGTSILVTARDNGFVPETLVYRAGSAASGIAQGLVAWALGAGVECLEVSEAVLGKLASKDNPQSMLGVFPQRWVEPPPAGDGRARRRVGGTGGDARSGQPRHHHPHGRCGRRRRHHAHRVELRSLFARKRARDDGLGLRRAAGAHDAGGVSRLARDCRGDIVGTHLDAAEDFRKAKYRAPTLLLMGSEGPGLSALAAACTRLVKIPMAGRLDSLNLAVATALMLYQIRGPI